MSAPDSAALEALLERARLELSAEELEWVARAYRGYREQLRALHDLDLSAEEVGAAYLPPEAREE